MTVRQLMEKTPGTITIDDHGAKCMITPWSIYYEAFKDCVIDTITPTDLGSMEITLKTTLVKENG